jgi:sugar lactone lactonase YvrE
MSKLVYPIKLCFSPDGDKLYISDGDRGCVHLINAKDGSYIRSFGPCSGRISICLSLDGLELFATTAFPDPNRVNVFSTTDGSLNRHIDIPDRGFDICLSNDGKELYVSLSSKYMILVLNSKNGKIIRKLRGKPHRFIPYGICISPDGLIFIGDGEHDCVEVLTPSGEKVRTIRYQNHKALFLCIHNDELFVSCSLEPQIGVFRASDGTHLRTITTNDYPCGLCATNNNELYVADPRNSNICVYQL